MDRNADGALEVGHLPRVESLKETLEILALYIVWHDDGIL
jgi:hypothetical protein